MRALSALSIVLFVFCIPILLITTNLRLAANETRLYEYGFNKYDVSAATGLDAAELRDFANQMITYFNSDDELFETELFNEREIAHLKDVKGLIRLAYYLQLASAIYIALYIAGSFAVRRRALWPDFAKRLVWGGGTTVAFLAIFGFWAATDFDSLFLLFHLVGFRNDLWQLYPGDTMILMFPQGFFNEAALFVAGATIVEAIMIAGAAWGLPKLIRRLKTGKAVVIPDEETGASSAA
ncbi:MAG: TIGR01906 family membrane protein [Dehalococcoidia bacterium]|nr:MAG: TIGR01906 family membrane protein [Dehalococcoidia bacterium]